MIEVFISDFMNSMSKGVVINIRTPINSTVKRIVKAMNSKLNTT